VLLKPLKVAIVVIGPCQLFSIGSVVDILQEANRRADRSIYDIEVFQAGNPLQPARSSVRWTGASPFSEPVRCDWLWVLADVQSKLGNQEEILARLLRSAKHAKVIGGSYWGTWWLASAGLLKNRDASVHIDLYDQMILDFKDVNFNQRIFDLDERFATSSGGYATVELLLTLITQGQGTALAQRVASAMNLPETRTRQIVQPTSALSLEARKEARLMEALHLMESNMAEPLPGNEIARLVGLSTRQLERLFREHLGTTPSAHYIGLRLDNARTLLDQTNSPAGLISRQCGFTSPQYFSYAYRRRFGVRPRDSRSVGC
jgi:transcriptional regulator GlxA family with amidase domain